MTPPTQQRIQQRLDQHTRATKLILKRLDQHDADLQNLATLLALYHARIQDLGPQGVTNK